MTDAPDGADVAPTIDGYTYVRPIGHGGFSDVYLYEQTMPKRQVAIKVLRTDDLSESTREQFAAEANLMARVSNHSNIAAIFAADVDDDGQPYLVMEYCSGGSLGAFYRHYPMSVKDVLSLGIRLSGALEAAHRAGIVHRDVKPANVLLTEYGVPVLSDFGISTIDEDLPETTRRPAGTNRPGTGESSVGMSLPWAAPETLWDSPVSDARSDRYSLAATLYSLLEGRSPHEVPGGPNSAAHLTGRIQSGFIGAIKRPDIPPSLQAILRRGLSHDRAARFDSAADFGRALQGVQRELGFEVTPLEVPRGEAPTRPPEPSVRVHQPQPIQLPEGHATLAPEEPGPFAVPGPPGAASFATASQPSAAPGVVAPSMPSMSASSYPSHAPAGQGAWPPRPPRPWDLPAGAQVATHGLAQPRGTGTRRPTSGLRILVGVLIGVLLLACVVVASLLIARAGADPTYEGDEIDHLEVSLTSTGVYRVEIPEALPIPDDVQVRVLETGTGDQMSDTGAANVSVDSAEWVAGEGTDLNPMESENLGQSLYIDADELAELGIDVTQVHEGDVVLVAAPVGWFANYHPDFGVNYSDGTLVVVKIIDAY